MQLITSGIIDNECCITTAWCCCSAWLKHNILRTQPASDLLWQSPRIQKGEKATGLGPLDKPNFHQMGYGSRLIQTHHCHACSSSSSSWGCWDGSHYILYPPGRRKEEGRGNLWVPRGNDAFFLRQQALSLKREYCPHIFSNGTCGLGSTIRWLSRKI